MRFTGVAGRYGTTTAFSPPRTGFTNASSPLSSALSNKSTTSAACPRAAGVGGPATAPIARDEGVASLPPPLRAAPPGSTAIMPPLSGTPLKHARFAGGGVQRAASSGSREAPETRAVFLPRHSTIAAPLRPSTAGSTWPSRIPSCELRADAALWTEVSKPVAVTVRARLGGMRVSSRRRRPPAFTVLPPVRNPLLRHPLPSRYRMTSIPDTVMENNEPRLAMCSAYAAEPARTGLSPDIVSDPPFSPLRACPRAAVPRFALLLRGSWISIRLWPRLWPALR